MKIAMLGHKRIPSREGGVEVVVEELAARMVALGHDVTCYNRGNKKTGHDRKESYKGIRIRDVWTINARGAAAFSAAASAAFLTAFGHYDIVHFHAEGPCIMLWLPKLFGKRCIATIHGLDHQRAKWGNFARQIILLGEKCAARYADEIIVLSKDVQKYFKEQYGRETILIPNGVGRPQIREADIIRDKWGLEKDSYILFLGRLVPEKGAHYLIDAYERLSTQKKLVIAGGSSDTDQYVKELLDRTKENENIIFTDFVQGELLDELYSNAYIYCLPSDLEGMPLTLLEAMSYGNCCLTSDIGECVDVVGDYALHFTKGSVEMLAEQLGFLCKKPEIVEDYRRKSAEYICNRYDWGAVVEKTLEIYQHE